MKAREELKIRFEVVVWFNDVRNEQKSGADRNDVLCKMFSWYKNRNKCDDTAGRNNGVAFGNLRVFYNF